VIIMLSRAKRFSIKQIATQAGVSKATVDRVLHQRGSFHQQNSRRIEQALGELEAQEKTAWRWVALFMSTSSCTPRSASVRRLKKP
jgi:Transcriptional regulators